MAISKEAYLDEMFEELKEVLGPRGWSPGGVGSFSSRANRQLVWRDEVVGSQSSSASALVRVVNVSGILVIWLGPSNFERRVRNARNVESAVKMAVALTENKGFTSEGSISQLV